MKGLQFFTVSLAVIIYLAISYLLCTLAGVNISKGAKSFFAAVPTPALYLIAIISVLLFLLFILIRLRETTYAGYGEEAMSNLLDTCIRVLQNDSAEGLKQLITVTSVCMTFSVSMLNDEKSAIVMLAWLYWGLSIICCMSSILISVINAHLLYNAMTGINLSHELIRKPSNTPELICSAYGLISFILGFFFLLMKF